MAQLFANPMSDRVAKHFLKACPKARLEFLSVFSGVEVYEAEMADENYNPFSAFTAIRDILQDNETHVKNFINNKTKQLFIDGKENKKATRFINNIYAYFSDIKRAIPTPRDRQRNYSSVDFLCKTNQGFITIEFQINDENHEYWDERSFAYAAAIYGNQLRAGDKPKIYDPLLRLICLLCPGGTIQILCVIIRCKTKMVTKCHSFI